VKFTFGRIAVLGALVFVCAGLTAFGQSVTVEYTGGYSTTWGNNSGDFGAGIYTANINGTPSTSGIICDDFNDEIYPDVPWTAKATQVSTLANGNVSGLLFGGNYTPGYINIGVTGYAEVATLVSMMFGGVSSYNGITGITQAELSSAIWDITQGNTLQGLDSKASLLVAAVEAAFNGNTTKAENYLATLTNLWILTPSPNTGQPGEAQEMWTENLAVAEGGAALMYLLLGLLGCSWAFFVRNRKRAGA
jgi:hypothetical protein